MTRLYLDHNATTPLCPEALEAMLPLLSGEMGFGNPSSIHAAGRDARAALDEARDRLAALIGARPGEIIFTGGGTEADNLALIGLARRRVRNGSARHVIISQVEHHAVLHAADYLERYEGFTVTRLPVDGCGRIRPTELSAAITQETAAVSLMAANNEMGTVQPVAEFAAICREAGVPFHTDFVQGFGKLPVRVDGPDLTQVPDALSIAAHKFYGPKGVGALWLRTGGSLEPVSFGGAQENGRRPGTENVAAIVGMAAAAEAAVRGMAEETARLAPLLDRLWEGIAALYPAAVRNGACNQPGGQLANTLNVSFPGLDGETLLIRCDLEGLCVSGGSACMAGSPQPSHVLLAMGVPESVARASLRFSLGRSTTAETVSAALERLARVLV